MKYVNLTDIAKIQAGYPFRGSIKNDPKGDVHVIQMRDVSTDMHINWKKLNRTTLKGRRERDYLKTGLILFVARGNTNYAVCLDAVPVKCVCSPHFFQIKVKAGAGVMPEFLSWQINQPRSQLYFMKSSEGSGARSIRRGILEDLSVPVPPMNIQEKIVNLNILMRKEQTLLKKLSEKRKDLITAACMRLIQIK